MRGKTASYEMQDFYLLERFDDVAILKLGKNFLFETIDRAVNNPLLDVFDHISKNDEVKVLVIMNCLEQIGCEELDDTEIKSHLKYTMDWDQAKRFVKTKKQLPKGLLASATAPLHKAPYEPDVIHGLSDVL